jgi:hypothetical protein
VEFASSGVAADTLAFVCLSQQIGRLPVKKGRHRRFEEARALKRTSETDLDALLEERDPEPCPECGADPGRDHASWCLYEDTDRDTSWPS